MKIITVLFCFLCVLAVTGRADVRDVAPALLAIANTGSMRPTLDYGDAVLIEQIAIKDVAVGKIVDAWNPATKKNYCHRVIKKCRSLFGTWYLVTQGDNSPIPDQIFVTQGTLNGVVTAMGKMKSKSL